MSKLRPRTLPTGFIAPCLPTRAPQPPSGAIWLHEIKWDGFRVIARKEGERVRLYSRPGNDLTHRFPLIAEAVGNLRSRSCIIDGEAVACGDDGIASFDRIRYRRHDADVFMWAFDLIELNGTAMRREPLTQRKLLERALARAAPGLRFNEHLDEADGPLVFHHACKLGLEGIVSKRRDSLYSSGRSRHWIKSKNPIAPAVKLLSPETALTLRARLAWAHDWVSDPSLSAVFLTLPGSNFIVDGALPAKNSALTSAGAEFRLANGITILAKFDGDFASHSTTYAGTGTVRYTW